ncbi:MAG: 6-phosphogluconolactonase [Anaerolineae bacterium]|nr:6-phosphogluconolactonase [Anaerolineae bacterium]
MAEIVKLAGAEKIAEEAARRWVQIAREAVADRGVFRIMLSGGYSPRLLYQLMATDPWQGRVSWEQTCVFWADERRVAPSDPESNYRMAHEMLLEHVPVPDNHIFQLQGTGLASSVIRDYENKLRRHFQLGRGEWPRFDLVLLGLGVDGHIASIFPGTRAVSDLSNMVVVYEVPSLQTERVTVTLPVINNARHILFLVSGDEKADPLREALEGPFQPSTHPAQAVKPIDGALTWLVDKAAARRLTG